MFRKNKFEMCKTHQFFLLIYFSPNQEEWDSNLVPETSNPVDKNGHCNISLFGLRKNGIFVNNGVVQIKKNEWWTVQRNKEILVIFNKRT